MEPFNEILGHTFLYYLCLRFINQELVKKNVSVPAFTSDTTYKDGLRSPSD